MITLEDFLSAASKLVTLGLDWKWVDSTNAQLPNSLGQGYLERSELRPSKQASQIQTVPFCSEKEKEDEDRLVSPDTTAAPAAPCPLISWRFHICYSHSYREPVMYFQASEQSGTPLPFHLVLNELEQLDGNIIENSSTGHFEKESLPAITQEDHPVLNTPFLMLHPCQTGEIMALLASKGVSSSIQQHAPPASSPLGMDSCDDDGYLDGVPSLMYLLAWLCVAGGPLGIAPSPLEYLAILRVAS